MSVKEKYILFGAVENTVTKYIIDNYSDKILFFVDNNIQKYGQTILGYEVVSPNKIIDYPDLEVIICTYSHWDEIEKQILELAKTHGYEPKMSIALKDKTKCNNIKYYAYAQKINLENPSPRWLNLELSGICNCSCFYCPFHGIQKLKKEKMGLMSWNTLEAIVKRVKNIPTLKFLSTTGAGEIFLHSEWYEMLLYVLDSVKFEYVNIYTNGMLLNSANINKLLNLPVKKLTIEVSIDGRNEEENDNYRKGSKYAIVKDNVLMLKKAIETDEHINLVITNCYPYQANCEDEFSINSKENVEVPYFLKRDFSEVAIVSQYTFFDKDVNPVDVSPYELRTVTWEENFEQRCLNLFDWIAIDNEGDLLRCSCAHPGVNGIANVFNDDVFEIWKNDEVMNKARRNFVNGIDDVDMCGNCPGKGIGSYCILVDKKSEECG